MTRLTRSYTLAYKVKIAQEALSSGKSITAKKYNVPLSTLSGWVKTMDAMNDSPEKRTRRKMTLQTETQRKDRAKYPVEEKILYDWFLAVRARGVAVTPCLLQSMMLAVMTANNNSNNGLELLSLLACPPAISSNTTTSLNTFKASSRWYQGCLGRYNLSYRTATTSRTVQLTLDNDDDDNNNNGYWLPLVQSVVTPSSSLSLTSSSDTPPVDISNINTAGITNEKILNFYTYTESLQNKHQYDLSDILNMDEVPMYFDMPSKKSIAPRGSKHVVVRTTGHEKSHFTVALTCAADGSIKTPTVIFKGSHKGTNIKKVRQQVSELGLDIHVCFQKSGWMNDDIMKDDYLKSISHDDGGYNNNNKRRLLILDSFGGHLTDNVKRACHASDIDMAVIPGGYTSVLQPLDIGIIKPFKDRFRKKWNRWMLESVFKNPSDTINGKLKRVEYIDVCKWVCDSWQSLHDSDIIRNAWRKAFQLT